MTHLASEAERSITLQLPQYTAAFRTGEARRRSVSILALVVVVVDYMLNVMP